MHDLSIMFVDQDVPRARLALLLEHFSELSDDREAGRIMYPLEEVLLLVTCATIASCDDFDDIVGWGEDHLDFLRGFSEFHFGIPCELWRPPRRALPAPRVQSHRSSAVRPLLRWLDCRAVAGPARPHRHRWQDGAAHPRPSQRAQGPAYALS